MRSPLRVGLVLAALVVPLVVVPVASAKLPSNRDRTIVIGRSIGGVAIGQTARQAVATWGPSRCAEVPSIFCVYEPASSSANYNLGYAAFDTVGGRVRSVQLKLPWDYPRGNRSQQTFDFRASQLTRYRTDKGIGLGSTLAQLRRAYPAVRGRSIQGGAYAEYKLTSAGRTNTFQLSRNNGTLKINQISIARTGA